MAKKASKEHKDEQIEHHEEHSRSGKKDLLILACCIIVLLGIVAFIVFSGKIFPPKELLKTEKQTGSIAAYVNLGVITTAEVDRLYAEAVKQNPAITKEQVLNQTIVEMLLLQEAESNGISMTDDEVEQFLSMYLAQNGMSEQTFEERLAQQNLSKDDFLGYFKRQLVITQLFNATVLSSIEPATDDEALAYYTNNTDAFTAKEGEIRARHILVKTQEEATAILDELVQGKKTFAELAVEKSLDTGSAARGGDLGFFGKGQMVKPFEDAAFALQVGQISEPVETQFGFHIIKREADTVSFDEIKDAIKQLVASQKQQETLQAYVSGLVAKADIKRVME
ncbi:peptidylprolyl isomerase [Candidatus Woesearchaeota archaeon]|nr:peptidylprolyl isomerase [Candidatus Woesearchaeota archaeon]